MSRLQLLAPTTLEVTEYTPRGPPDEGTAAEYLLADLRHGPSAQVTLDDNFGHGADNFRMNHGKSQYR